MEPSQTRRANNDARRNLSGRAVTRAGANWLAVMIPSALAAIPSPPGATITRRYKGKYGAASAAFQRDSARLSAQHWFVVSQGYVPGQWSRGDWITAVALAFLLIGFVVFVYMIAAKPAGEIVAIYEYRPPIPASGVAPPAASPVASVAAVERLAALTEMRDRNLISIEEFEAKKSSLLDQI